MPDITMCKGKDAYRTCLQAHECYRATATPSQRQGYFAIVPVSADGLVCGYYWPPSRNPEVSGGE